MCSSSVSCGSLFGSIRDHILHSVELLYCVADSKNMSYETKIVYVKVYRNCNEATGSNLP